jgi:tyrosine-protein phosphatase YwqE
MVDELQECFPSCHFSLGCELNVAQENLENALSHSSWDTIGNTKYLLVEFNGFDVPTRIRGTFVGKDGFPHLRSLLEGGVPVPE